MINKFFLKIALALLIIPTLYLFSESFVTSKKKTPSVSKLKEQCCEECAAILELTPDLLRAIADLHQTTLNNLRTYIDDGKDGFIATKSKEQLVASHERLIRLRADLEALTQQMKTARSFLESGYAQVKQKP